MGTSPDSPITPGWKESKTESGESFFINEITNAKVNNKYIKTPLERAPIIWLQNAVNGVPAQDMTRGCSIH